MLSLDGVVDDSRGAGMAMGRQGGWQGELMLTWDEVARSPGHAFYDKLQEHLIDAGFDAFAEQTCAPYYASRLGAPSIPPGRYFRMHLIGYFEGIDSERGLEWRCSDSLSLRDFLGPWTGPARTRSFIALADPPTPASRST